VSLEEFASAGVSKVESVCKVNKNNIVLLLQVVCRLDLPFLDVHPGVSLVAVGMTLWKGNSRFFKNN
jgi:hypothetical protein